MTGKRAARGSATGAPSAHNDEIATAFDEMAELLAIQGENPFRVRAYERAAQVVRGLPRPLAEFRGTKELDALPGIGADLAAKIDELLRTRRLAAVGLPWIPPELREDRGEIEAGERKSLPKLVTLGDLRGDLHAHSDASDGHEPLAGMAEAAREHGLEFLAITDHSRYLGVVHGLDAGRLSRQIDAIDALNERLRDFTVLKGAEVDILEDGGLALPHAVLRRLDVVVAAVHSHFSLPEARQTARILRALERPCVSILAHPTGRLIGERAAYAVDFKRILAAARARPCYLELNAQPSRLDMDDVMCKAAGEHGVLVSVASDAHSGSQLADLAHGIRQARRGWLTAADVLNARPLREVRALLARARL